MPEAYHLGLLKSERFKSGRPITKEVAEWAYNVRFEDLSESVLESEKRLTIDFLASAIPGVSQEPIRKLLGFVRELKYPGPCTIIGTSHTTGPQYAALISGAASGVYNLDASHRLAMPGHIGLATIAAALGMSQIVPMDFRVFATALAVGLEVEAKVNMSLNPGVGCVDTSYGCAMGAAVLVAKVLGLSMDQFVDTLGLASYQAASGFEYDGPSYWARRNHYGWLSAQGIHAALQAKAGLKGPENILEGPYGFINQFSGRPDISVFDRLGKPWEATRIDFKRWKSTHHGSTTVDVVVGICEEAKLKADEIDEIVLEYGSYMFSLNCIPEEFKRNPTHPTQGMLSNYWLAACAAVHRRVWIPEYEPGVFFAPEIKQMIRKVKCFRNTEYDSGFPDKYTCACTIKTVDGRTYTKVVDYPEGSTERPVSTDQLVEKYHLIYSDGDGREVMTEKRHREVLDRVQNMHKEKDIGDLVRQLGSDTGYEG